MILFPDNTVICNYGAVGKVQLLITFLNGRGRWTQAVQFEASRSARTRPDIGLLLSGHMGEAIEIEAIDHVEAIRVGQFGGTPEKPLQHLGEAETVYVIKNMPGYSGSGWITDDLAAYDFGTRLGIQTWDTRYTIEQLVAGHEITAQDGFAMLNDMWNMEQNPRRMPQRWQDLQ